MKILIIEDEARTAVDLAQTLKKINPQIMILNILDSISSTVTYLKTNSMPDLIYMDIQLSDVLHSTYLKKSTSHVRLYFVQLMMNML